MADIKRKLTVEVDVKRTASSKRAFLETIKTIAQLGAGITTIAVNLGAFGLKSKLAAGQLKLLGAKTKQVTNGFTKLKTRLTGTQKGLTKTATGFKTVNIASKKSITNITVLGGKLKGVSAGFKRIGTSTQRSAKNISLIGTSSAKSGKSVGLLGGSLRGMGVAAGAAGTAITIGVLAAVAALAVAAIAAVVVVGKLAGAFKNAALAAIEVQAKWARLALTMREFDGGISSVLPRVREMASIFAREFNVPINDTIAAFQRLVDITGDTDAAMKLLLPTIDTMKRFGRDATTSAKALADAYNGNIEGLITLDPLLKEAIEDFKRTAFEQGKIATSAEIAAHAIEIFNGKIKDAAKESRTTADAIGGWRKAVDGTKETIGRIFIPAIDAAITALTNFNIGLADSLKEVGNWVKGVVSELKGLKTWFKENAIKIGEFFGIDAEATQKAITGAKKGFEKTLKQRIVKAALPKALEPFGLAALEVFEQQRKKGAKIRKKQLDDIAEDAELGLKETGDTIIDVNESIRAHESEVLKNELEGIKETTEQRLKFFEGLLKEVRAGRIKEPAIAMERVGREVVSLREQLKLEKEVVKTKTTGAKDFLRISEIIRQKNQQAAFNNISAEKQIIEFQKLRQDIGQGIVAGISTQIEKERGVIAVNQEILRLGKLRISQQKDIKTEIENQRKAEEDLFAARTEGFRAGIQQQREAMAQFKSELEATAAAERERADKFHAQSSKNAKETIAVQADLTQAQRELEQVIKSQVFELKDMKDLFNILGKSVAGINKESEDWEKTYGDVIDKILDANSKMIEGLSVQEQIELMLGLQNKIREDQVPTELLLNQITSIRNSIITQQMVLYGRSREEVEANLKIQEDTNAKLQEEKQTLEGIKKELDGIRKASEAFGDIEPPEVINEKHIELLRKYIELSFEAKKTYEEMAEEIDELLELETKGEFFAAQKRSLEEAQRASERLAEETRRGLSDAIIVGMDEGGNKGIKSFVELFKNRMKRGIADSLAEGLLAGGIFGGGGFFSGGGLFGGGGATGQARAQTALEAAKQMPKSAFTTGAAGRALELGASGADVARAVTGLNGGIAAPPGGTAQAAKDISIASQAVAAGGKALSAASDKVTDGGDDLSKASDAVESVVQAVGGGGPTVAGVDQGLIGNYLAKRGRGGILGQAFGGGGIMGAISQYAPIAMGISLIAGLFKKGKGAPLSGVAELPTAATNIFGGGLDVLRGSEAFQRAAFSGRNIRGLRTAEAVETRLGDKQEVEVTVNAGPMFAVEVSKETKGSLSKSLTRGTPNRTGYKNG